MDSEQQPPKVYLHPRREAFEHGLLPIPKLIFTDGLQSLSHIKSDILSSTPNHRVNSETLSRVLQIPPDHSRLLIETISVVLHRDSDPLLKATTPQEMDKAGVNVFDLLLFLYIQNYKRLLPKSHKDSAAVADVWPSTSAFDGILSVLSPLQLVRSNSRRFVPSQGDEEAHQLSYLHKHIGNILCLLADSVDGKGNKEGEAEEEGYESMVLSVDKFEHLGFLLLFGDNGSQRFPLSQNTPFFANSDPNMPASPVPAPLVLDWLLENISSAQEHISERSTKENGPSSSSDQDVAMADAAASSAKPSSSIRGPSLIEGVSKSSCVKQTSDIKGTSVKVVNCHESVIYIMAPVKYATVYGCSDATIVLGAVGKAVRVEHCERVHLISTTKRICIANCRECVFFLGVNQKPLIVGDNHKLQVAPYNTFYPQLEEHMNQVGIDPKVNNWDKLMILGVIDPHDSLSHPAGGSDIQSESATCLDPDHYTNFVIPSSLVSEQAGSTNDNPFPLPDPYLASQQKNHKSLEEVKQLLRDTKLDDTQKRELSGALHSCFKEWLFASGNVRQLYYLPGE
ncbi:TBCC domain-containing protein 1-like [Salvia hispanica]|uniref:TBCC domain-containing protein 1-like n=1 Tax=Salvia hispanica TaxID=49212 RepID=UPI002008FAE1|nr:TBCC domain-containing protein 1-like [Salvia hispanica]